MSIVNGSYYFDLIYDIENAIVTASDLNVPKDVKVTFKSFGTTFKVWHNKEHLTKFLKKIKSNKRLFSGLPQIKKRRKTWDQINTQIKRDKYCTTFKIL